MKRNNPTQQSRRDTNPAVVNLWRIADGKDTITEDQARAAFEDAGRIVMAPADQNCVAVWRSQKSLRSEYGHPDYMDETIAKCARKWFRKILRNTDAKARAFAARKVLDAMSVVTAVPLADPLPITRLKIGGGDG